MAQSTSRRSAASHPFEALPTALPLSVGLLPSHANDRVDDQGREQNQEAKLLNSGGHAEYWYTAGPLRGTPPYVCTPQVRFTGTSSDAREDQLGGSSL